MKATKLILIAASVLIIESCHTSKKTSTSTVASAPVSNTTANNTTISSGPRLFVKPEDGIYPPRTEELLALQIKYTQYKDATLDQLKAGYTLYTETACVKCHGADNIYRHVETEWVKIIDEMALKARLSAEEKDAVFKYVIAIKSTQGK